jgi:phosphoserine phosphatase RsbU/P
VEDQVLTMLRGQLVEIVSGTVFLFIGLAACAIAAIRRWRGVRLLLWLGVWSATYGIGSLIRSNAVVSALPHSLQRLAPYASIFNAYLTVVIAFLAFLELCVGKVRILLKIIIVAALAVALAGIGWFLFGGSAEKFITYNHIVTVGGLVVIITLLAVKKLSDKFLVLVNRRVLAFGTLLFTVEALWVNMARPLRYNPPMFLSHLAFAVFLLSFGYVAVQIVFTNEIRLLSIENELEVARQLQFSILPTVMPDVGHVRIAITYRPMTAVAGDFYDFIPMDRNRVGFLVADVTGHGVPAALIASMIKGAMQSVVPCAHDPREVLRRLNRVLFQQLHGQLVSAAYLWLDIENHKASYSAAGHPPLLRLRGGQLQRIESNGLLFGVVQDPDYPVCELPIQPGDRFLLYTDGLIEPENANGDSFGDCKLEELVCKNASRTPSELSNELFSGIQLWQSALLAQQDDITLVVVDLV